MTKNQWQQFFDGIAPDYDSEVFTRNTEAEVEFLCEELKLSKNAKILDIGCGTGRHAVALAQKGFKVTGVDISQQMLNIAGERAKKAGVSIELVHCPAQEYKPTKKFDAAISLCEGALCLFSDKDDIWRKDMAIFSVMTEALEKGNPFLITVLNAMKLLREFSDQDVKDGKANIITLTTQKPYEIKENGVNKTVNLIERYYTPGEIVRMVSRVGLRVDNFYGGTAGNWRRELPSLDEIEFMAVGHRRK